MELVGLLVGFVDGALVLAVYLFVVNTKRWHDKHHNEQGSWDCDRCLKRHFDYH